MRIGKFNASAPIKFVIMSEHTGRRRGLFWRMHTRAAPAAHGTGKDATICEMAETVKRVVGSEGELIFDISKPDGTPRNLLDVSRLTNLGWIYTIELEEGLHRTYQWYLENVDHGVRAS